MTREQIAEMNAWAYEPLTGEGHIHGLVLRLLDERAALLETSRRVLDELFGPSTHPTVAALRDAIAKAESP